MSKTVNKIIDKVVDLAIEYSNDKKHGYSQYNRWGPDYDCSSFLITIWTECGVNVKAAGATNTWNMISPFKKCGFKQVAYNRNNLRKGDVLVIPHKHTVIYIGNGKIVHASIDENGGIAGKTKGDQTGKEICATSLYDDKWTVLRYKTGYITSYVEAVKHNKEKYYKKCSYTGVSIVDGLKSIGVNSSYGYRSRIAIANGISGYRGTPAQNTKMLNLLKKGKLKKAK